MMSNIDVPQHREDYDERYDYCIENWGHESELWMNCITRIADDSTETSSTAVSTQQTQYMYTTVHGNTGTST